MITEYSRQLLSLLQYSINAQLCSFSSLNQRSRQVLSLPLGVKHPTDKFATMLAVARRFHEEAGSRDRVAANHTQPDPWIFIDGSYLSPGGLSSRSLTRFGTLAWAHRKVRLLLINNSGWGHRYAIIRRVLLLCYC